MDLPHYQWRIQAPGKRQKFKNAISKENIREDYDYPMYDELLDINGANMQMNHILWDKLYIPEFIGDGYWHKTEWRAHTWKRMEGKPFTGQKNPHLMAFRQTTEQKFLGVHPGSPMGYFLKKPGLFPQFNRGKYLLALPTLDEDTITLNPGLKDELGEECIIFREPVVSKNNVFSVPIKYDEKTPLYTVKIPRKLVLAANGDFDGDHWGIIPYTAKGLRIEQHALEEPSINRETIDIETVPVKKRTKEDLIMEAGIWYNSYKTRQKMVEEYGGLCNRASYVTEDIEEQKRILELHAFLEVHLKPERTANEDFLKEYVAAKTELKALVKKNRKEGEKTLIDVLKTVAKNIVDFNGIIGYKPSGFWLDILGIPFSKVDIATEEAISELKAKGKISLWSLGGN